MKRREFNKRAAVVAAAACLGGSELGQSTAAETHAEMDPAEHYAAMRKFLLRLAEGDETKMARMLHKRRIGMLVYPGMFPLDLWGPYAVLKDLLNTEIHFVSKHRRPIAMSPGIQVTPDQTLASCPENLDVLFVPGGGMGTVKMMQDQAVLDFLARQAASARYVTSVCTGSLVLGAAGLLQGYRATSYWAARDILSLLGAQPVQERWVKDGNRITGAGVTAGIDFSLYLASLLAGENYAKALQLNIEYNPEPPFHAGTPQAAGEPVAGAMRYFYAGLVAAARIAAKQSGIDNEPS